MGGNLSACNPGQWWLYLFVCRGGQLHSYDVCLHALLCEHAFIWVFSVCVVFKDDSPIMSHHQSCTCIFSLQTLGFIGCCSVVDEVTEGCHVFLFLPTSWQLPAGFPQTIKYIHPPVALVITPPIRIKSEEEYQWVRKVKTTKLP